jgi:hypothetical protein
MVLALTKLHTITPFEYEVPMFEKPTVGFELSKKFGEWTLL